jgi:putative ABC transport system ATP-binding protein
VLVNGAAIHQLNEGQVASWRGVNVGLVFQFFQLIPTLTAIENIMLPMDFCNVYPDNERERRARYLLELVGIAGQAGKLPAALSGGEQQRVAIAWAWQMIRPDHRMNRPATWIRKQRQSSSISSEIWSARARRF